MANPISRSTSQTPALTFNPKGAIRDQINAWVMQNKPFTPDMKAPSLWDLLSRIQAIPGQGNSPTAIDFAAEFKGVILQQQAFTILNFLIADETILKVYEGNDEKEQMTELKKATAKLGLPEEKILQLHESLKQQIYELRSESSTEAKQDMRLLFTDNPSLAERYKKFDAVRQQYSKAIREKRSEEIKNARQQLITALEENFSHQQSEINATFKEIANMSAKDIEAEIARGGKLIHTLLGKRAMAAFNEHVKHRQGALNGPAMAGQASACIEAQDEQAPIFQFAENLGKAQVSLDTETRTLKLLFIYNMIPILDLYAAYLYIRTHGAYNTSISLLDNLIFNSHHSLKMVALSQYKNEISESAELLKQMKKDMYTTYQTQNFGIEEDTWKMIGEVLTPSTEANKNDPSVKRNQQILNRILDRLATINGQLTEDAIQRELTQHFDYIAGSELQNLNLQNNPDLKSNLIQGFTKIIAHTSTFTADQEHLGKKIRNPVSAAVHKNINARRNLADLMKNVNFRDFGDDTRSLYQILLAIKQNPSDPTIWGATVKTDVFQYLIKQLDGTETSVKKLLTGDTQQMLYYVDQLLAFIENPIPTIKAPSAKTHATQQLEIFPGPHKMIDTSMGSTSIAVSAA
jgi:hypothetical protein